MKNDNLKLKVVSLSIFVCAIFFLPKISLAATYYVSTSGSDSNNGTSQSTPWAHCPGMSGWNGSATLHSGDTVYFKNSETWTASSGDEVLTVTAGVTYDGATWGSGTRATLAITGNINESVIAIYRSNVTVKGFNLNGNSHVGSGLWVNYNSSRNIDTIVIDNVVAHDFAQGSWQGHGIGVSSHNGYHVTNVTITNCVAYNNVQLGIMLYPGWDVTTNYLDGVTVRGCELYNNGTSPDNKHGIMIKDDVRNAVIEYNYIHDNGDFGVYFETSGDNPSVPQWTNITVRYNLIYHNDNWGIFFFNSPGVSGMSASIYGNLIISNGRSGAPDGGGMFWYQQNWSGSTFNVYNNTIYDIGNLATGAKNGIRFAAAGTPTMNFKNNIIYSDSHTPVYDSGNKMTHSNNMVYRTSGFSDEHINNGTSYNRAGVKTWEPTAQNTDPLFKNISSLPTGFTGTYGVDMGLNSDGLSLQSSSPAINAGYNLGSSYNGAINLAGKSGGLTRPQGNGWDIGAYEYVFGAPDTTPPAAPTNVRVS